MIIEKALLAGLAGVSLCMANISGIVTDTGTTPISGAVVQLEKGGWTATTGADGRFALIIGSTETLHGKGKLLPNGLSAKISGNMLTVTIAERSAVEVTTFDLNGKALSIVRQTIELGIHTIALPQRSAGVFLYKVKSGNKELFLKGNSVGLASSGSWAFSQGPTSNFQLKQAKAAVAINDVIAATKTGYLNYRVFVFNSDTSGIVIKMIPQDAGTVTDIDGNVYHAIRIGNQVWMAENLRVTKYNDGSAITKITDSIAWTNIYNNNLSTPAYCYYYNMTNTDNIKKFGALYNWYVVNPANSKKIAPSGWHVPSDSEWTIMEKYLVLNGYNWNGTTDTAQDNKIGKSLAAKTDWYIGTTYNGAIGNDLTKNNRSGFSALPGGYREVDGDFSDLRSAAYWWSATEKGASNAYYCYLYCDFGNLYRYNYCKSGGFSVRLVKD